MPAEVRTLLAIALIAALGTSCSGGAVPRPPQGSGPSLRTQSDPRPASTPLDYIYVLNYSSVAQWSFDPNSTPMMQTIAPRYRLPRSCQQKRSLVLAPRSHTMFVVCNFHEIVPLAIRSDHTIGSSGVPPLSLPTSPGYAIAPRSGVPNMMYVSGQAGEDPGTIAVLSYDSGWLKLVQLVPMRSQFPQQMAFYTDASGRSRLYVAAPWELTPCIGARRGAILAYAQLPDGRLKPEKRIVTCAPTLNVIEAGGNLYWSGGGGYSLETGNLLPSPSPLLPVAESANAMSVIMRQRGSTEAPGTDFELSSGKRLMTIFGGSMKPAISWKMHGRILLGGRCVRYDRAVTIARKTYGTICWQLFGNKVVAYGITRSFESAVELESIDTGRIPSDIAVTAGRN